MDTWKPDSSKKPRIRQKQSHEISETVKQLLTLIFYTAVSTWLSICTGSPMIDTTEGNEIKQTKTPNATVRSGKPMP